MLQLENLNKRFGGLSAVQTVSFEVKAGQIVALIGPNGAGKSSTFNLISGILKPDSGQIILEGTSLKGKLPHQIVKMGMARTFQKGRLFKNLTVQENIETGLYLTQEYHISSLSGIFRLPGSKAILIRAKARLEEILDFLELDHLRHNRVADLAYGQQRLVEIGRALATNPKLLLLDEPAAGMNPYETEHLGGLIRRLQQAGQTILLVEHSMDLVMEISDWIVVLNYGKVIAQGQPREIQQNPEVLTAYLGSEYVSEVSQ